MKHNVEFKSFDPDVTTRRLIENRIEKLERKITTFPSGSTFLRILVEAKPARKLYRVGVTIDVPGKTIAGGEESHDPDASIKAVFDELERQLQKHKETLRHERLWKRVFKREELRQLRVAGNREEDRKREAFFELVNPHLEWLDHFVRHLIRYSEAMGEIVRDELNSQEVVDWALIAAYRQFVKNIETGDVRSWFTRLAVDRFDAEIDRISSERQRTPVQEEVWHLGEEIIDFYQPDEALKVEDVIPEVQKSVADALDSIPEDWRQILLKRYSEGQSTAKIADSAGRSKGEVRRILSYSARYVRQRLIESGCVPTIRRRAA